MSLLAKDYTRCSISFNLFIGSRGNYFKFDSCTFFGNKGVGSPDEIGAAISVALFSVFEQRVSAVQHDIINW